MSTPPAPVGPNTPDPQPKHRPTWATLHLWQIQPIRDLLLLAAIFAIISLGYRLSLVTVPLLLAILFAYLFEPLVQLLTRRKAFTRPMAAGSIILGALLVILIPAGFGAVVGGIQLTSFSQTLSTKVSLLASSINNPDDPELKERIDSQGPLWAKINSKLISLRAEHIRVMAQANGQEPDPNLPPPDRLSAVLYDAGLRAINWIRTNAQDLGGTALATGAGIFGIVTRIAGSVGAAALGVFLTAFFFFFICSRWGHMLGFMQTLIPERRRGTVIGLVSKMDAVIAGFIRGRLTICAILMVYYSVGYWLIGLPAPLIIGPIIGVLATLPYAAGIGIPLATVLLLASPPDDGFRSELWWAIAAPLLIHGIAQVLDDYILTPKIQGDRTGMNTPTILFASLAGGILMGFYGLLIAIPVAACIKIVLKEIVLPRVAAWAAGQANDPLPVSR